MTRIIVRAMLGSIAAASLIGIVMVLGGGGETSLRVLGTTLTIAGVSAIALACWPALTLRRIQALVAIGISGALVSGSLLVLGLWTDEHGDTFWQATLTALTLALLGALAGSLSQVKLATKFGWVRGAAIGSGFLVAMLVISDIWSALVASDLVGRLAAVLGIAVAGLSLAVIALGYVSHTARPADGADRIGFYPRCGKRLWVPPGEIRCGFCAASFFIELRTELPQATLQR